MRPSKIRPGTKLIVRLALGSGTRIAYFVKRIPAECGRKAINYVRFPDFAGVDDPAYDGTCQMSDYDVSRRCDRAQ